MICISRWANKPSSFEISIYLTLEKSTPFELIQQDSLMRPLRVWWSNSFSLDPGQCSAGAEHEMTPFLKSCSSVSEMLNGCYCQTLSRADRQNVLLHWPNHTGSRAEGVCIHLDDSKFMWVPIWIQLLCEFQAKRKYFPYHHWQLHLLPHVFCRFGQPLLLQRQIKI